MIYEKRRVLVLDTSAFIAGFDPLAVDEEVYSIPKVLNELRDNFLLKARFEASVESGKLRVIEPSQEYINMVKKASGEVGDISFLSETDIEVLALAIQLKNRCYETTVLTDDYSIQNVAEKLGLNFVSLASMGIRYHLQWLYYCPACGKKYPSDKKIIICENCGTRLKRRAWRKMPIGKRKMKTLAKEREEGAKETNPIG